MPPRNRLVYRLDVVDLDVGDTPILASNRAAQSSTSRRSIVARNKRGNSECGPTRTAENARAVQSVVDNADGQLRHYFASHLLEQLAVCRCEAPSQRVRERDGPPFSRESPQRIGGREILSAHASDKLRASIVRSELCHDLRCRLDGRSQRDVHDPHRRGVIATAHPDRHVLARSEKPEERSQLRTQSRAGMRRTIAAIREFDLLLIPESLDGTVSIGHVASCSAKAAGYGHRADDPCYPTPPGCIHDATPDVTPPLHRMRGNRKWLHLVHDAAVRPLAIVWSMQLQSGRLPARLRHRDLALRTPADETGEADEHSTRSTRTATRVDRGGTPMHPRLRRHQRLY